MPENNNFNLLRFVYGELFLNAYNKTIGTIIIETWKAESWYKILTWLNNRQYISALKIERISSKQRCISYRFNEQNLLYPYYIQYLKRLIS